jgi:hypothetical protein
VNRVLIISPRFPPINAPDMHRVRHSLPYFDEMGWESETWIVDPAYVNRDRDPLLTDTVPEDADVRTVPALDTSWTRKIGLGSLALRSLPFYFWHVSRRLAEGDIDLVYFSTTAFPVLILGRYWKARFGVPYVIDMQDPWYTDYYVGKPKEEQPPKFWFSYRLNKTLEPGTMHGVDGIISVSKGYCDTLCKRYENVRPEMCEVIPFGAADIDFDVVDENQITQPFVDPNDDTVDVVYAGVVPTSMVSTIRSICQALRRGLDEKPSFFQRVQLHFIGTSYAREASEQVIPIAQEHGLADYVNEHPSRIPYFQSLRLLQDADHLIMPGTDEPNYTASKLYPYILSKRPVLAVFNENSSVVDILQRTNAGTAVTFNGQTDVEELGKNVYEAWTSILERLPYTPDTNWEAFQPYTAEAMARRQVEVFDRVVERHKSLA